MQASFYWSEPQQAKMLRKIMALTAAMRRYDQNQLGKIECQNSITCPFFKRKYDSI
jgi:hypothetical protein